MFALRPHVPLSGGHAVFHGEIKCCFVPHRQSCVFFLMEAPLRTRDGMCDHALHCRQATCLPALSGLSPPQNTNSTHLHFIVVGIAPMTRLETFTFFSWILNSSKLPQLSAELIVFCTVRAFEPTSCKYYTSNTVKNNVKNGFEKRVR